MFQVFVERAQQPRRAIHHASFLLVEINVGDPRARQFENDLFVLDTHVLRFDFLQVHAGLHNPMSDEQDAVFPIPFDVVENHHLFEDVLDSDQLGQGLDLLDNRGGALDLGLRAEARWAHQQQGDEKRHAGHDRQHQSDNDQTGLEHAPNLSGCAGLQRRKGPLLDTGCISVFEPPLSETPSSNPSTRLEQPAWPHIRAVLAAMLMLR